MLLLLSLTLTINAISAATVNQSNSSYTGTTSNYSQKTTTTSSTTHYAAGSAAGSTKTIKVLIFSGTDTSTNCVNGLKTALSSANSNKLVSGVTFSYATSTKITSTILSGYDVLIMPGGSGGYYYLNSTSISGTAIKNFVASGKGYIGICAGAYAAAAHTNYYYNGWGIAPHVYCNPVSYEGLTTMAITSNGASVLNRTGTVTLAHYNGPAMYLKSSGAIIFGTYADNKTGYKGYADIVGDFYGSGRTVLIGSHPELSPQNPNIIANLILWATKTSTSSSNNSTTTPTTTTKVTLSQIAYAANIVKTYYASRGYLPSYVTINNTKINMPNFLYLLSKATTQINSKQTASITVKGVYSPTNPSGSYYYKSGAVTKSYFVYMANKIIRFNTSYNRAPNYVACNLGYVSFTKLIYMYSKILSFYRSTGRLPNYVTM